MTVEKHPLPPGLTQLAAYDYDLPNHLIARHPAPQREQARMMVIERAHGRITHTQFSTLLQWLAAPDCVVLNNTQVLPNRLLGHREGQTGVVEVFLLHPITEGNIPHHWTALLRPTRKLAPGTRIMFANTTSFAEVQAVDHGTYGQVRLHLNDVDTVPDLMEKIGHMPIPPYLGRPATEEDKTRYQTVYAKVPGSHAAPTAGLHFTPALLAELAQQGIKQAELTLAVSTGTFKPVIADHIKDHEMDAEFYTLPEDTVKALQACRQAGGRIVAVGTTSVKTLETASQHQQGLPTQAETGWSKTFITPGFTFAATDAMLTNFHLPKSTLMMLVAAFAGYDLMQEAYRQAVAREYRFYSYGDCMLII
jgi:S-adenosylmethionine:tRNA ribosyltransferase-isomerase